MRKRVFAVALVTWLLVWFSDVCGSGLLSVVPQAPMHESKP